MKLPDSFVSFGKSVYNNVFSGNWMGKSHTTKLKNENCPYQRYHRAMAFLESLPVLGMLVGVGDALCSLVLKAGARLSTKTEAKTDKAFDNTVKKRSSSSDSSAMEAIDEAKASELGVTSLIIPTKTRLMSACVEGEIET